MAQNTECSPLIEARRQLVRKVEETGRALTSASAAYGEARRAYEAAAADQQAVSTRIHQGELRGTDRVEEFAAAWLPTANEARLVEFRQAVSRVTQQIEAAAGQHVCIGEPEHSYRTPGHTTMIWGRVRATNPVTLLLPTEHQHCAIRLWVVGPYLERLGNGERCVRGLSAPPETEAGVELSPTLISIIVVGRSSILEDVPDATFLDDLRRILPND